MSSRALSELVKNITSYPLFVFCRKFFWREAAWFFSSKIYTCGRDFVKGNINISTIICEVTTAYLPDRLGRRVTLLFLFIYGDGFVAFVLVDLMLGPRLALALGAESTYYLIPSSSAGAKLLFHIF